MLDKLKKLLPQSQFAKGVSILVGGTAGAQLIMILISPLLTRLYTPEDFGLLAVYAGLLSLLTVISSFRYELAIPLPQNDQEAADITLLSFIIVCIVSIISLLLTIFFSKEISSLLKTPQLDQYLWLLPIGVFLIGSYQVFNYWAIRKKSFSIIAKTKIKQTLATVTIQLVFFKMGGLMLLIGQTIGQGVGTSALIRSALTHKEFKNLHHKNLLFVAKKYKRFPLYSTISSFTNTLGMQLPPILFATLFSPTIAGLYALSHRILTIPISVLGSAISNVFFSNAAEAYRNKTLKILFENTLDKLMVTALPIMILIALISPTMFSYIFGDSWKDAGYFARWLTIWLTCVFIVSPLSILYEILERQEIGMIFQIIMLITRSVAIFIGASQEDILLTIQLFSISSAICWIWLLSWLAQQAGSNYKFLFSTFIANILKITPLFMPLIFTNLFTEHIIWTSIGAIASLILISAFYFKQLTRH